MTRFNNIKQITSGPGEVSTSLAPSGGDDWLSRVHNAINAFKEAMEIFKELRGMGQEENREIIDQGLPINPGGAPKANPDLAKFLTQYGDMTIDEILELIKPMKIKQLMEMIRHGTGPGK